MFNCIIVLIIPVVYCTNRTGLLCVEKHNICDLMRGAAELTVLHRATYRVALSLSFRLIFYFVNEHNSLGSLKFCFS